jgi:hypothetical protein
MEYMFAPPMLGRVAIPTPAGEEVFYQIANLPLSGVKFDHMTAAYMYPGHEGFEQGHYDVHFYTITPEERYQIVVPGSPPAPVTIAAGEALPEGIIKVSDVIPAMGEHWIVPGGWPWGPTFLVNKGNRIGVEYEFNHEPLKCAQVPEDGTLLWVCDLGLIPLGTTLDHLNIEYLPQGHEGMTFWHFALHMYNITPEERGKVLP